MRLESAAPRSRVKRSTTEPLRSLIDQVFKMCIYKCSRIYVMPVHSDDGAKWDYKLAWMLTRIFKK